MINSILQTNRLNLRPFSKEDAYVAAYNSRQPSVAAAMSDMVLLDETASLEWINWINKMASSETTWQILAIELMSEKKCIGLIGIIPQKKINGEFEILFSISDEYQNNGYATEASEKMIEWFFTFQPNDYLCAIVKLDNPASQKVIEKLGFDFVEEREIVYDNTPTMFNYYKLTVPQYKR